MSSWATPGVPPERQTPDPSTDPSGGPADGSWSQLKRTISLWYYATSTATLVGLDYRAFRLELGCQRWELSDDLVLYRVSGGPTYPPQWAATALLLPAGRGDAWRGVGLFFSDETP